VTPKEKLNRLISQELYGSKSWNAIEDDESGLFIELNDDTLDENVNAPSAAELLNEKVG